MSIEYIERVLVYTTYVLLINELILLRIQCTVAGICMLADFIFTCSKVPLILKIIMRALFGGQLTEEVAVALPRRTAARTLKSSARARVSSSGACGARCTSWKCRRRCGRRRRRGARTAARSRHRSRTPRLRTALLNRPQRRSCSPPPVRTPRIAPRRGR